MDDRAPFGGRLLAVTKPADQTTISLDRLLWGAGVSDGVIKILPGMAENGGCRDQVVQGNP